jgi:hypothetical protein
MGAGALACLLVLTACGDDPVRPEPIEGAGLRFVFDDVVPVSGEVLVEVWCQAETWPPTCMLPPLDIAAVRLPLPGPDLCTRGTYVIRNILGEVVKSVAEESWTGRAPAWNTLDGDGNPVPSGIYPIRWQCLDSAGQLEFNGHYYVTGLDEEGACSWLIWSGTVDPTEEQPRIEISGFPEGFSILTVEPGSDDAKTVVFENPYLLQVHVPDRPTFGQEVELEEGSFTEVRVTFPAS